MAFNGRVADNNLSEKEEMVRVLFGLRSCEAVLEDFSCAIQGRLLLHGRMYITVRHLCFYSTIFGFEKKKVIPFTQIRDVSPARTIMIIDNALEVKTSTGRTYFFASFFGVAARDEAVSLLRANALGSEHGDEGSQSVEVEWEASEQDSSVGGFFHGDDSPEGRRDSGSSQGSSLDRIAGLSAVALWHESGSAGDPGSSRASEAGSESGGRGGGGVAPHAASASMAYVLAGSTPVQRGGRSGHSGGGSDGLRPAPGAAGALSGRPLDGLPMPSGGGSDALEADVPGRERADDRRVGGAAVSRLNSPHPSSTRDGVTPRTGGAGGKGAARVPKPAAGAGASDSAAGSAAVAAAAASRAASLVLPTSTAPAASSSSSSSASSSSPSGQRVGSTSAEKGQPTASNSAVPHGGLPPMMDNYFPAAPAGQATRAPDEGGGDDGGASEFDAGQLAALRLGAAAKAYRAQLPSKLVPDNLKSVLTLEMRGVRGGVREFFARFLADDALCGMMKFHQARADTGVTVSPWAFSTPSFGVSREIHAVAAVLNAPIMAPKSTRMHKIQRLLVYGGAPDFAAADALVLETSVSLLDIPFGDYFTVEDRWIVRAAAPDVLSIEFALDVRFKKSTFFKSMILSRTQADIIVSYKHWFSLAVEHVAAVPSDSRRWLESPAGAGGERSPSARRARKPAASGGALPSQAAAAAPSAAAAASASAVLGGGAGSDALGAAGDAAGDGALRSRFFAFALARPHLLLCLASVALFVLGMRVLSQPQPPSLALAGGATPFGVFMDGAGVGGGWAGGWVPGWGGGAPAVPGAAAGLFGGSGGGAMGGGGGGGGGGGAALANEECGARLDALHLEVDVLRRALDALQDSVRKGAAASAVAPSLECAASSAALEPASAAAAAATNIAQLAPTAPTAPTGALP